MELAITRKKEALNWPNVSLTPFANSCIALGSPALTDSAGGRRGRQHASWDSMEGRGVWVYGRAGCHRAHLCVRSTVCPVRAGGPRLLSLKGFTYLERVLQRWKVAQRAP
ncbi:unnamed protein product [Pleuronectes platessa]|uniref:Uncharacterized protein n=1 Tax=Pleuronectes platessa TaxID=8262 RepID=A0A9N7V3E6_PLEPL|nr:unnamed protein product [Pleuronectes platessa]